MIPEVTKWILAAPSCTRSPELIDRNNLHSRKGPQPIGKLVYNYTNNCIYPAWLDVVIKPTSTTGGPHGTVCNIPIISRCPTIFDLPTKPSWMWVIYPILYLIISHLHNGERERERERYVYIYIYIYIYDHIYIYIYTVREREREATQFPLQGGAAEFARQLASHPQLRPVAPKGPLQRGCQWHTLRNSSKLQVEGEQKSDLKVPRRILLLHIHDGCSRFQVVFACWWCFYCLEDLGGIHYAKLVQQ